MPAYAELAPTQAATENDRLLQAESAVRGYCGWHIAPSRTETLTTRVPVGTTVILPSLHVTDVASITRDETLLTEGVDYTWSQAGIVAFDTLPLSCAYTGLVIVYTHGYPVAPPEVSAVVQALAQRATNAPDGRPVAQVGLVRYSETANSERTNESAVLDRYRLPALA